MPKIPTFEAQVPVKSNVIPTTGLQPVRANTIIPEAIGGIGQAIGQIGDAIYKRELKHREEDIDIYINESLLKEQTADLQHLQKIKTTEGSDRLQAILEYQEEKKNRKDPTDPNNIDTSNYYGKRAKQFISDTDRKKYQLKKMQFDSSIDMKVAILGSEARKTNATQMKTNIATSITAQLSQGLLPYAEAVRMMNDDARTELSPEENVILNRNNIRTMTGSYIDSRLDVDDEAIARAVINKEFDLALIDPTAKNPYEYINQYRDRAAKTLKGINVDRLSDKYTKQLKDPFDVNAKQAIEEKISSEKVSREEKQAILNKFRYEVNQKQQDIREGERFAEDKIFSMMENKESPSKIIKAIRLDSAMRPSTRMKLEELVLKGDDKGGLRKSDPATLANTMLGIQEEPERWDEDNIREMIKGGKLHPKDGYLLIEDLRKRLKEGPTKPHSELAIGLKRLQDMAKKNDFITKKELESVSDVEAGNLNATRYAKAAKEYKERIKKGEEADKALESITKPYVEEKTKGLLDSLWSTMKDAAMPKARKDAIEVLKRNNLPITNDRIEKVIQRMREKKQ